MYPFDRYNITFTETMNFLEQMYRDFSQRVDELITSAQLLVKSALVRPTLAFAFELRFSFSF